MTSKCCRLQIDVVLLHLLVETVVREVISIDYMLMMRRLRSALLEERDELYTITPSQTIKITSCVGLGPQTCVD